jgi:hypothetical protein
VYSKVVHIYRLLPVGGEPISLRVALLALRPHRHSRVQLVALARLIEIEIEVGVKIEIERIKNGDRLEVE